MNNAKLLLLDFDGTLTPIVKTPDDAKLPANTKKLLKKLSGKEGIYIAIISGRKLDDIKEKIGLSNIMYGGNHGLEGEILGEKYSFPIPDKMLLALKETGKQLDKIAGQFKGTSIEDKGLTLSFHYRLIDEKLIPEIKLLINKVLEPYISNKLIASTSGKKVIDITPNVNWNKGDFAALVIKKITEKIKTRPEIIVIGDDTTDENIFKKFKEEICIKVGTGANSKARHILKDTRDVFGLLEYLDLITQIGINWRGLVRDASGRWLKYYKDGMKYFKYGKQSKPDLTDMEQFRLIKTSVDHEKAFLSGLKNKSFTDIKSWLIKLHKIQAYKGKGGKILTARRVSRGEHSKIVKNAILPLAKKYADPYKNTGTQTLYLSNISAENLPRDEWKNSNRLMHYYPDPAFLDHYLQIMVKTLVEFMEKINYADKRELLVLIARYYQYAINMHMFENVNQSLFCNQANSMLKLIGLKPIEHGVLDFAAMRLQPNNFTEYFIDEVKR